MGDKTWFLYVVLCRDDTYYTGITTNLQKRLATHNAGRGAKYTKQRLPVLLKASIEVGQRGDALRAEYQFKRLSRRNKELYVAQGLAYFLLKRSGKVNEKDAAVNTGGQQ